MPTKKQTTVQDKVVFSAIKPTGGLTLGNYLGALQNFGKLASNNKCIYAVADLHSLTVDNVAAELRHNSLCTAAMMLASGLDKGDSTVFVQSHVSEHSQLAWVLNCFTQFGEARRMTQFKDKSKGKNAAGINLGLFSYPSLMAADILLYNAEAVPIGDDQKQHLELARTIAERFNNRYSPTFVVPEGFVPSIGARVYSLADPSVKMSKTDTNPASYILMTDDTDTIVSKFRRAVTDSGSDIIFDRKNKPGISNLITILAACSGKTVKAVESECKGLSYADFKTVVAQAADATLAPIRDEYKRLMADKEYVQNKLAAGADSVRHTAVKTMSKVYRRVGLR